MFVKQLMTRKDKKMAKKGKTIFVCQECGYESTKWMGRCICCLLYTSFAVFDMAAETGIGLQQFLEAFDIPVGKFLDLRFVLLFVFIGNGNDVKISFLSAADGQDVYKRQVLSYADGG